MICNAKILSTMLGLEDHDIMTFFLHLEFNSSGQGYGGYALDWRPTGFDSDTYTWRPSNNGLGFGAIRFIIETVGVRKWEDLKGQLCRIEHDEGPGMSQKILRIGHILEDKWFDLKSYMKEA